MEHLLHFGLAQDPFVNAPRVEDWCALPAHVDAQRRLARGLAQGKALLALVGDAGSGKTTLVRHLLEGLDEARYEASLLVIVPGEPARLLRRVARHLGVEEETAERTETLRTVFDRLVDLDERGRRAVVIVDGAEALSSGADVDDLRALLGFEHGDAALLSFVLVGGPALDALLQSDAGLGRRVEIRVRLTGLDRRETGDYVCHRIARVGGDPTLFGTAALAALHAASLGLPRVVNSLADNALYEAFLVKHPRVSVEHVLRAAQDLGLAPGALDEAPAEAALGTTPTVGAQLQGESSFSVEDFPGDAGPEAAPGAVDALGVLEEADALGVDAVSDELAEEPWDAFDDSASGGEVSAAVELIDPDADGAPHGLLEPEGDVLELSQPVDADGLDLVTMAEPAKPDEEVDELFAQLIEDPR